MGQCGQERKAYSARAFFLSSESEKARGWLRRKEEDQTPRHQRVSKAGGGGSRGGGEEGGSLQNCLVAERLLSQHLQGGRGLRKAMGGLKGPA